MQSNNSIREDLLRHQQEADELKQTLFQYKVENEDLRDRLNLLSQEKHGGVNIDYIPYIASGSIKKLCDSISTPAELSDAKLIIFNHIFSIQKENRNLQRRLKATSDRGRIRTPTRPAVDDDSDKESEVLF